MEIIYNLLSKYYQDEGYLVIGLIILSLISNIIQTTGISHFNAKLITAVQGGEFGNILTFFKWFMLIWVVYATTHYIYQTFQYRLIIQLRQWLRFEITRGVIKANSEQLSNINFTKIATPISRTSTTIFYLATTVLTYLLPSTTFFLSTMGFMFYNSLWLGSMFMVGNFILIGILLYKWSTLRKESVIYENDSTKTEGYLIEVLNNMDKVVLRGQSETEIAEFKNLMNTTVASGNKFYLDCADTMFIVTIVNLVTVFCCIGYAIYLFKQKQISITLFLTIFTLCLLYREKVTTLISEMLDYLELTGRAASQLPWFEEYKDLFDPSIAMKKYDEIDIPFQKIQFDDVSFRYPGVSDYVYENKSIVLNTSDNNIIGITGKSGQGKSSIAKILLKLYPVDKGVVSIDGRDITLIDADYIKNNVTYVNQNAHLFDKTIVENVMYGCKDTDVCKKHYDHILTYPKIIELFREIDLDNDNVGYSGEKISGGQRQITGIIGGLINPSKILILDEPTNGLDQKLKTELMGIIKYFKTHKQCIIIITHDSDIFPLFTEQIKL